MWLGVWRNCSDQPLGLTWVTKMKKLGVVFGIDNVEHDNWEPRLSKLDKTPNMWKSRSLSLIGKALIINIFGISKLLYLARVLVSPDWVIDKYNKLIWPFLWGSKIETVARKSLHVPVLHGGLNITDFKINGEALRLASISSTVRDTESNSFYLTRYFIGSRLGRFGAQWSFLRDNSSPSASRPTTFYTKCVEILEKLSQVPSTFAFNSKSIYIELRKERSSPPLLPRFWAHFIGPNFDIATHWPRVRDSIAENFKNDLSWLITLRAVKVRDSLRGWGYIREVNGKRLLAVFTFPVRRSDLVN